MQLFNAHYDEYGFQPIVVFDGEPAAGDPGQLARKAGWAPTAIIAVPKFSTGKGQRSRLHPEFAPNTTLRWHVEGIEASTKARLEAAPKEDGKLRRFKEFFDGAKSWSRVERIIARIEVGVEGPDTRFIVTNLKVRNARVLYEDVYVGTRLWRWQGADSSGVE